MDNSITLNAGLALDSASSSRESEQQLRKATEISFAILARISNSTRLSDNEKSFLINDVALVDRYAQGSLKTKLLSEITATAFYIEKYASVRKANPFPPEVKEPVNSANVGLRVRENLNAYVKQLDESSSLARVVSELPADLVAKYIDRPQIADAQTYGQVDDVVDIPLPGAGLGSSTEAELVARAIAAAEINIPSLGDVQPHDLPLVDIPSLPLPGQSALSAEDVAVVIQTPDVRLPGEAVIKQFEMEDLTLPTTIKFA